MMSRFNPPIGGAAPRGRLRELGDDWRFGTHSIRAEYDAPLEVCVTACRRALNRQSYVVTGGNLHESDARIDARSELLAWIRVTLEAPKGSGRTRISFSSGRVGGDVSLTLREEFERCLADMRQTQP